MTEKSEASERKILLVSENKETREDDWYIARKDGVKHRRIIVLAMAYAGA